MKITIFILVFILIAYFICRNKRNNSKKEFIIFGCTLLGLEAGLRHIAVGPDTPTYYMRFSETLDRSWTDVLSAFTVSASEFRDPAYALITKIFSSVFPFWQFFLLAIAFLYFYSLGRMLFRYIASLEGVLFAFVLYLSLFHIIALSGIRQCITTALTFLIIPLINSKKWGKAVPIILLGSTIHISFLFVLLLFPFLYVSSRINKNIYFLAIILVPVVAIGARNVIFYMTSFLSNDYYAGYAEVEDSANPIAYVLLCSLISLYEFMNFKRLENDNMKFLIPSAILMTLTVPLIFLNGTMIRIGQYFTLFMMVSLPMIFDQTFYRKFAYAGCIIFLSVMIVYSAPDYYFFWEDVPGFYY